MTNVPPEENEEEPHLDLCTEKKIIDEFEGERSQQFHEIFLSDERKLKCRHLAAFFNEIDALLPSHINENDASTDYLRFSFKDSNNKIVVHLHIYPDISFHLYLHRNFIRTYGNENDIDEMSFIGSQGRMRKTMKMQTFRQYTMRIDLKKDSSRAFIHSLPMIYYPKSTVSLSCHWFVKNFIRNTRALLRETIDSKPLLEYDDLWISAKKKTSCVNSLETFLHSTIGFLHITLMPYNDNNKFESVIIDGTKYSIINGIYIAPYSESLFLANQSDIDGILMDTTWKVISKYVTSILMAESHNVGIPVAFVFGKAEDKELYSIFIDKFNEILNVNLKNYYVESDQGSALKSVCDSFNKTHFACLRHYKVSLKSRIFSHELGILVSCRSQHEFEFLKKAYEERLREESDEIIRGATLTLFKAGMCYEEGEIKIIDEKRWNQVSMIKRIDARMPSTTNSLESTHGHLNSSIPRRNDFWPSLLRLTHAMTTKTFEFNDAMKRNYKRIRRNIKRRCRTLNPETMEEEKAFYETTETSCKCGETALESAMFRISIPCSHQLSLGVAFPDLSDVKLNLENKWNECEFSFTVHQIEHEVPQFDAIKVLKESMIKNIKKFSHFKNKGRIEEFVENTFDPKEGFVLGKPLGYYTTIHEGINYFISQKKSNRKENISESSDTTELTE